MIINFLFAAIKAGTPLLFGTTGEIMTEKSGNLNLGVEGMMFMGAFMGFFVGFHTGSLPLALLAAFIIGNFAALIYAFLTVTMMANQNVTGLTLTIFGIGFAKFFGEIMIRKAGGSPKLSPEFMITISEKPIPVLGEIPVIGKLIFSHNPLVYLSVLVAVICSIYIMKTRAGLNMRAVGENPAAADAAGIKVTRIKYLHIMLGGGICGLGGAYLSLINGGGVWNNSSVVNGQGWISVALVIFASWSPMKAIFGSLVFGAFSVLQFYAPKDIIHIPNAFYVMLPFLITTFVLIFASMRKSKTGSQPAGCGINYFREER
ncbi:ABC transporter permease [Mobilitalea sibirica]|uniref:ABC transporter permease n=1 Tax=Mobilitalea sibirica TaxID=1462919 RepID=A0A8J7KTA4_9FIRM|nr:ABC transporter permease [Mobilitalea sibirica]MBH1941166.1 ABC transporter permease [Mobilitalea sibirica]